MQGVRSHQRRLALLAVLAVGAIASAVALPRALVHGQSEAEPAAETGAVVIEADYAQQWIPDAPPAAGQPGNGLLRRGADGTFFLGDRAVPQDEVLILRGRCRLVQGGTTLRADEMVIWRRHDETGREAQDRLVVYLEDNVRLERPGQTVNESSMFVNLASQGGVKINARRRVEGQPATGDALYQRALDRRQGARRNSLRPAQLVVPGEAAPAPAPLVEVKPATGIRRVRISPRSALPFDVTSFPASNSEPREQVWVLTGGINVLIDDTPEYGTVDLSADSMVIWTPSNDGGGEFRTEITQSNDTPFTVYLEGNIVIRQQGGMAGMGLPQPKTIRASEAIYDAREERALILNAELRTFVPQIGQDLRLRAARIRQLAEGTYYAQNAWTTASQFGRPGYRLQASDVFIEPRVMEPLFGVSPLPVDPLTGQHWGETVSWLTSLNNTFFVYNVPVFYLPRVAGPAEDINIPLRNVTVRTDRVFGTSAKVTWDLFDLLGIDKRPGTRANLFTDYYGKRGPAIGGSGTYRGTDLFGIPGQYWGQSLLYYVHDTGRDRLGNVGRLDLPLGTNNRYWINERHKQYLPFNMEFRGEIGILSDRNFEEQYFEQQYDTGKDVETLGYLKQQYDDNQAWSAMIQPRTNDFFVMTQWLPQLEHYLLGERLLGDVFTWYGHNEISYAQLNPGAPPTVPGQDIYNVLPWTGYVPTGPGGVPLLNGAGYPTGVGPQGAVLQTRQELDAPFNLGPLKIVPYAMGEAAYFGESLPGSLSVSPTTPADTSSVTRLWGSVGVRSSLMFWRVYPYVQSQLFNVNGLAHKVLWEMDAYSSQSTASLLNQIPQYHEMDDNAQQRFRQHFINLTYNLPSYAQLPTQLDPRFYAVRYGAGHWASAPWYELVDDIQVVRFALRQRLQTKVGPPERLRIRDWMTLDLEASYFPDQNHDNFGQPFGLLQGRYLWAVGDRTSIMADALYDTFMYGQQLWDIGISNQRDARGNLYLGLRQIQGPPNVSSQFAIASYNYILSPKWNSTLSTTYDIGEHRNVGEQIMFTRVGADWLFYVGASYDAGKNNTSFAVALEPRLGNLIGGLAPLQSMLTPGSPAAQQNSSGR